MRRFLGLLLMASVLRLTAFDALRECERHAEAAAAMATAGSGHEHHADGAGARAGGTSSDAPTPASDDADPIPKCCVVTGTCGSSTLAGGVVSRVRVGDALTAIVASALRAPRTTVQAPEPPPPKA